MQGRLRAAFVALLLFGCDAAPPQRPVIARPTDPLDANWLGGRSTVTAQSLASALALGAHDPEVSALLAEAEQRLGGGTFAGLAARFKACSPTVADAGGFTLVKSADGWLPRSLDDLAFGARTEASERELAKLQAGPSRDLKTTTQPDFVFVERTPVPEICIAPRLTVVSAYEAIVHELVHALKNDPRGVITTLQKVDGEAAFQKAVVLLPGGEVDAYTIATRARLRLRRAERSASPVVALFDPATGELRADRSLLADRILAPRPDGLGYSTGFMHAAFADARAMLHERLVAQRDFVQKVLTERQTNLGIIDANTKAYTHNVAAHRYNVGIAEARGDGALRAKEQAAAVDSGKSLARTRALFEQASASRDRLLAQLQVLTSQLDAMGPVAAPAAGAAGLTL